jgi:hypothetical protein
MRAVAGRGKVRDTLLNDEEVVMNFALRASLLLPLLAIPAQAQDRQPSQEVKVSTSVICDTQQQMERFVVLYDGNAEAALHAVNDEAHDASACVVATIAYVVGDELGQARIKEGTFQIVKVLVVGMRTPRGFQAVVPAPFVSLVRVEEVEA